ncbi:hypothetical protein BDV93DRAFT_527244 [Ceratobasidium sp. AG-I]|nr:hypothetical protein BDV93DRAFT_527244 [Ceratobasidium sp. AG-I]
MPDAFALWDVARKTLDDAIQHYLDSSITLAAVVSQSSSLFPDQNSFEAAVNTISHDINSIESRHERLESAQTSLRRIRNKSSVLIPFNKLPLEIMTRIFHVAAGRSCACDETPETLHPTRNYGPKTLLAITHVCTYWRHVATSTAPLWSHVTFHLHRHDDFIGGLSCPETWLRRACGVPIYVHLDGTMQYRRKGSRKPGLVVSRLLPYLNKITGFRLTAGWTYSMTRELLRKLLAAGGADSVREFIHLGGSYPVGTQELLLAWSNSIESPTPSLRVLDVGEMCFAWESAIYRNLVDLRLEYLTGNCCPTIQQLLGVLSACPDLRVLCLSGISFEWQDNPHLIPVTLGALELLDIINISLDAIPMLLPFIFTGKSELSVRVNCLWPDARHEIEAITSFFRRSSVTRLFIFEPDHFCISKYLKSLHDIRVLIIDFDSKPGDRILEAITCCTDPEVDRPSARCPKLQSLYLLNGALANSTVQAIVEVHTLRRLAFGACFLDPFEEELVHWLKPMVADVTCVKKMNLDLHKNWYLYMT